jgi:hypothetical protein
MMSRSQMCTGGPPRCSAPLRQSAHLLVVLQRVRLQGAWPVPAKGHCCSAACVVRGLEQRWYAAAVGLALLLGRAVRRRGHHLAQHGVRVLVAQAQAAEAGLLQRLVLQQALRQQVLHGHGRQLLRLGGAGAGGQLGARHGRGPLPLALLLAPQPAVVHQRRGRRAAARQERQAAAAASHGGLDPSSDRAHGAAGDGRRIESRGAAMGSGERGGIAWGRRCACIECYRYAERPRAGPRGCGGARGSAGAGEGTSRAL